MEMFSAHWPLTKASDAEIVFFDLRLNKRLSKQSRERWFETPSRSYDVAVMIINKVSCVPYASLSSDLIILIC